MNQYIISPSASRDLDKIAEYFLSCNIEAGEKLFREFNSKCQKLVNFHYMGRSYDHLRPLVRGLPLDGYIIFYRIIDDEVKILRVFNGRQNLESLLADVDNDE
ncbi:MAG: type II toxin-antitoxin system RelE/ParE family toxin [Sphaerospermopsis sp. SIO1G1]|nr:type II toxin-antitoxin system RelE/ParE family toxin [Sphaerospermopsis sp. SIO1G1]